jgi:hypothetical protein
MITLKFKNNDGEWHTIEAQNEQRAGDYRELLTGQDLEVFTQGEYCDCGDCEDNEKTICLFDCNDCSGCDERDSDREETEYTIDCELGRK